MNYGAFFQGLLLRRFGELGIAAGLLLFWLFPNTMLRFQSMDSLPLLFLTEIIFGFATVGVAVSFIIKGFGRYATLIVSLMISGVFFYALIQMGLLVQVAFFLFLTFSRVYRLRTARGALMKHMITAFVRVMYAFLTIALTMAVPVPALGMAHLPVVLDGAEPQRFLFWGVFYFTTIRSVELLLVERLAGFSSSMMES